MLDCLIDAADGLSPLSDSLASLALACVCVSVCLGVCEWVCVSGCSCCCAHERKVIYDRLPWHPYA